MATVTPTNDGNIAGDGSVAMFTWTPLTTHDADGSAVELIPWADRCVQVTGTFGAGGTVVIEGSNDNSNWATLYHAQGSAASFTAAGVRQIVETPRYVRPRVTAGDGTTSLTVSMTLRRANPMRT